MASRAERTAAGYTDGHIDLVDLMVREAGREPLLTADRERELANLIARGRVAKEVLNDTPTSQGTNKLQEIVERAEQAVDLFVRSNMRLVVSTAREYLGQGSPFPDLVQEGYIELVRSVWLFEDRGARFSTFAVPRIRRRLERQVKEHGTIRLPQHVGREIPKIREAQERLRDELGREPSLEELAAATSKITLERLRRVLEHTKPVLSLDHTGTHGEQSLMDFIPNGEKSVEDQVEEGDLVDGLERALGSLPPREARVLELLFGLNGRPPHNLQEVGNKFGLTKERIRQIKDEALDRLRHPVRSARLREYLG